MNEGNCYGWPQAKGLHFRNVRLRGEYGLLVFDTLPVWVEAEVSAMDQLNDYLTEKYG